MPYDFALNDEQRLLQQQASRTVQDIVPFSLAREAEDHGLEHVRPLWKQFGDLGWKALSATEAAGGAGMGAVELMLVAFELGRRAAPLPFVAHNAALDHLSRAGKAAPPGALDGREVVTLAIFPPNPRSEITAGVSVREGDGQVQVSGAKYFVPYADLASAYVVTGSLPDGSPATVLVPASQGKRTSYHSTGRDGRAVVEFDASLPASALVTKGDWAAVARLHTLYRLGQAGYINGAARAAQDLAVEYSKQRVIFGRPLGTFQAMAHRAADMLFDTEAQYWLAMEAAWRLDASLADDGATDAACAYISQGAQRVSAHAHQIHGAIGFTFEHDLGLLTTVIKALHHDLGRYDQNLERVAVTLGL